MKDEGINFSEKAYEEHPDWFYEDVRETIKINNRNNDMRRTIKLSESEVNYPHLKEGVSLRKYK